LNGDLLTGAFTPGLLSTGTMFHPWERADLTSMTYDYLFPPLKTGKVSLRHGTVIGLPESGKTEMINDIAYHVRDYYGEENVNIVFCTKLPDALENMDDCQVQFLLVDDAVKSANSRKSGANADDAADYFEIRHEFERVARTRTGVIILIYVAQRFKSLDIVFRNAMFLWFRTSTIDPDDADIIKRYIGAQAYSDLEKISARMYYHHDDTAKGRCIIHLPLEHRTGYFSVTMRPRIIHMVGRQEVRSVAETFTFDRQSLLEQLAKDSRWTKAARAYRLAANGMKHDLIAQDPQIAVSRQRVGKIIAQIRGEISRRAGAAYEQWRAEQLTKEGHQVKHDGRIGNPDIVAIEKGGAKAVISCKVYDFERAKEIRRGELEPELVYANANRPCFVQLSVWNLWEMRQQTIVWADASLVPEKIILKPLSKG